MPSRIIREGLLDSEPLRQAGELAEILFTRLLLVVDDFGRFDGRVAVISRRCWPLGGPTEKDILERLVLLTQFKLVIAYEADGKPFIYIPKFKQRTRASKSKCPAPPDTYPQEQPPMTDKGPSSDGQPPGRWQASASVVRSSSFDIRSSEQPVDKSRSTPKAAAHSIARTEQNKRDLEAATKSAVPMPDQLRSILKPTKPQAPFNPPKDFEHLDINAESSGDPFADPTSLA